MSYIGRKIRERRILLNGTDVGLIVPIDHRLSTGPISGINNLTEISNWINNENISAIIAHKGTVELLASNKILRSDAGLIIHLNGMSALSNDPDTKQLVTNVESALRLGADAVSIQLNFLDTNFGHNFDTIGKVVDDAHKYGLPVLVMVYDKAILSDNLEKTDRMKKLTCAAVELGADALKISFPENKAEMNDCISHIAGMTKVFFAGGSIRDEIQLIDDTASAMKSGASGLCAGRNIFQNKNPNALINQLGMIIRNNRLERGRLNEDYSSNVSLAS